MSGGTARASARYQRQPTAAAPPPRHVYERSVAASMTTEKALAQLPDHEWTVLHDVDWPGRRYTHVDHVVVGPAGVFVIDSESWSGTVTVERGELRHNGRRCESAVAGAESAARTAAGLTAGILDAQFVTPILCFSGTSEIVGRCRTVLASSPFHLAQLLMTRPAVLDARGRAAVVAALHTTHTRVASPARPAQRPASSRTRTAAPPTRGSKPQPARAAERPDPQSSASAARRAEETARPHPVDITLVRPRRARRTPALLPESLLVTAIAVYWTQPQIPVALGTWLIGLFV